MTKKILSIAIPTYNRAKWLKLCLENLLLQTQLYLEEVEVTVYDNHSPDNTGEIVNEFLSRGFKFNYIVNSENIGSDANIAQCFNKANGQYVLILGDDDVLIDGSVEKIIESIKKAKVEYGAIYIRAYGYDNNFIDEKPFQLLGRHKVYKSYDKFLCSCSSNMAFISSLVINKSIIPNVNANNFLGTALVQTYLFFEAAKSAKANLFIDEYLVAAKRIEQRDYDVAQIFSESLNKAFDYFVSRGMSLNAIRSINRKLLWYFFPIFLINLRTNPSPNVSLNESYQILKKRFKFELFFWLCSFPILKLPRRVAVIWGYGVIVLSRLINGEFGRLFVALKTKLIK
jgi:glycosyltransferase involved in cell wall biosynthesis